MKDGLTAFQREAIREVLAEFPKVERAVLFGSRAMGTWSPASDVDLALFGDALTLEDEARIAARMEDLGLPVTVDLVRHATMQSEALREHVARCGNVFYTYEGTTTGNGTGRADTPNTGNLGWRQVSIGDLGEVVTGRTPPAAHPEYFGDQLPFLTPTDMTGVRVVESPARYLSAEGAQALRRVVVPFGVAVSCIGWQMGKTILIPGPAATNQQINTIIPDRETVLPEFLYYAMAAKRDEVFRLGAGGSRTPILNKSGFQRLNVSLPPIDEQSAIARILGALDDKIELNRKMNETLEAMARATFQSWFVDFDPVHAKARGEQPAGMSAEIAALFPSEFEDSELGPIPKEWRVAPLPEVIDINPTRKLNRTGVAPYLDMQNVATRGHRPVGWIEREVGSGARFQNGDTLLARITPCLENGKTAFVDFLQDGEVAWGSTEYIVLRPKKTIPPVFGYLLARDEKFREFSILNMSGSSGRQRVPTDCYQRLQLSVAPDGVYRAFADAAEPLFRAIRANDEQAKTLAALRDLLLPRLISGQLRVPGEASEQVRKPEGRKGLAQGVSPGTAGKKVEPRNGA